MQDTTPLHREERDLLIELRTELKGMREDVKAHMDGTNDRLKILEAGKIDRTEVNRLQSESLNVHTDHEARLRNLEKRQWLWSGASGVIGAVASWAVTYFSIHH